MASRQRETQPEEKLHSFWKRGLLGIVATVALVFTSLGGAAVATTGDLRADLSESDAQVGDLAERTDALVPDGAEDINDAGDLQAPAPDAPTTEQFEQARDGAPDADPLQLLTLTKSVAPANALTDGLKPGEVFTYTITVGCNQAVSGCITTEITDALPPELAGFVVAGIDVTHSGGGNPLPC